MSPLSSPFTSSVVIFFQRQYGSLRLYKKNYGEVGGGGQASPLPDTAHTEAEGTLPASRNTFVAMTSLSPPPLAGDLPRCSL